MGKINRFNLTRIAENFKTPVFFETGTFRGDGVDYALRSSFSHIISIEIVPEIAAEAKRRFDNNPVVRIIEGESSEVMEAELASVKHNCIFWLDAHFPGADAGMTAYDAGLDEAVRLPLAKESSIISRLRSGYHDVIIMDDLRIYEDGPYQNGNVPTDALPRTGRNIDFVYTYFGKTHNIHKLYQEEGYLLLLPKKKPGLLAGLFGKRQDKPDRYLVEDSKL